MDKSSQRARTCGSQKWAPYTRECKTPRQGLATASREPSQHQPGPTCTSAREDRYSPLQVCNGTSTKCRGRCPCTTLLLYCKWAILGPVKGLSLLLKGTIPVFLSWQRESKSGNALKVGVGQKTRGLPPQKKRTTRFYWKKGKGQQGLSKTLNNP